MNLAALAPRLAVEDNHVNPVPAAQRHGRAWHQLGQILAGRCTRWLIIGPCLAGGWYAWRRGDPAAPRVHAPSLGELGRRLADDPPRPRASGQSTRQPE